MKLDINILAEPNEFKDLPNKKLGSVLLDLASLIAQGNYTKHEIHHFSERIKALAPHQSDERK